MQVSSATIEMLDSYGIEPKLTMVKNPTTNAIHCMLGGQLRATGFGTDWSNDVDMLIQACAFALHATSPAQVTCSPAQLAFGHNLNFQQKVLIDY